MGWRAPGKCCASPPQDRPACGTPPLTAALGTRGLLGRPDPLLTPASCLCLPSRNATSRFTAIIWKDTTTIGCATTYCTNMAADGQLWTGLYYVCNYYPPGNINSPAAFAANVLPLQSS